MLGSRRVRGEYDAKKQAALIIHSGPLPPTPPPASNFVQHHPESQKKKKKVHVWKRGPVGRRHGEAARLDLGASARLEPGSDVIEQPPS